MSTNQNEVTTAPKQQNQIVVESKRQITFWKLLLSFLYNSITVFLCVDVAFILGISIIFMTKYYNLFIAAKEAEVFQKVFNSGFASILTLLFGIASAFLVVSAIFQDLVKNYQVDKENYKKIIGYFAIIVVVILIPNLALINLIIGILSIGLFYWLLRVKYQENKPILKNKILTLKNCLLIFFVSLSCGAILMLLIRL